MSRRLFTWGLLAIGVLIVLANTLFIVEQRQEALVLRFGEPVRVINPPHRDQAGLNFKTPFVENVITFDRRNQALESAQEEILTADQQRLVVDAFVRYRISDPLQYYRALRNETTARDRIERLVNSSLRQVLGSASQTDIVAGRRGALMTAAKADVARRAAAAKFGIQIIDIRIRRADLPPQIQTSVYNRMRSSRALVAADNRAKGEQARREIIAAADKEVTVTLATATEEAERTRGEGDAQRTLIFAQSFGRDPGFASFYRSMQAYEGAFGQGDTTMVLSPDSAFFKYFDRGAAGR